MGNELFGPTHKTYNNGDVSRDQNDFNIFHGVFFFCYLVLENLFFAISVIFHFRTL